MTFADRLISLCEPRPDRRFRVNVARTAAREGEPHADGKVFLAVVEGPVVVVCGRHADRGAAVRTAVAFYRNAARRRRLNKV